MIPFQVTNAGWGTPHVFKIPEILSLICDFSCTSDCARLSRTCKAAFTVSIVSVWYHVHGAQHLFSLLGDTKVFNSEKSGKPWKIVIGTTQFSCIDFSRFEVYAPHVRDLSVYGGLNRHYYVDGWKHLVLRAQQQQLLPNLLSITIQVSPSGDIEPDQFMWIKTLISPSLCLLEIIPNDDSPLSCVPLPMASAILEAVVERCPRLLALSLLPGGAEDDELSYRLPYQEYLGALPTLIELSCTSVIFEADTLPIIARLPQLRQLTVLDCDDDIELGSCSLPRESFPALRQLRLEKLRTDDLDMILNIPSLTSPLTDFELVFPCGHLDEEEEEMDGSIITALLSYLCDSPHLSSLNVDFNPTGNPYNIGHQDLMDVFSTLPLKSLALKGAHLGDWIHTGDLERVWPNVTSLHMPDQLASPRALSCFAQLPQVQHLTLEVCLGDLADGPMVHSHCPLRILELSSRSSVLYEPEQLEHIGRFLITVFPGLYGVVWSSSGAASSVRPSAQSFVEFLNQHIALKREVEELRKEVRTLKDVTES